MAIDLFARRGLPWDERPSFAEQIDPGDCWEWTGTRHQDGYGVTTVGRTQHYAHRLIWEALVGSIPDGGTIDHLCRNRLCVNPDHLEVVSAVENVKRGYSPHAKRWRQKVCKRGHALAQTTTQRYCPTCTAMRSRGEI